MTLKIAFQMEPLSEVNPKKNNTLFMMRAAQKRGYRCFQFHPRELFLENGSAKALSREVVLSDDDNDFYTLKEDTITHVSEMDVVLIRQDPPYNMEYITSTYMLEYVGDKTLVLNPPAAIRDYPEKIMPLLFSEFCPETTMTYQASVAESMLDKHGDIIIKPLYLFGGTEVHHITQAKRSEIAPLMERMVEEMQAPVVVQEFLPDVSQGDKRILILHGEPVGAFLRVPEEGSHLANLMQGGSLVKSDLTDNDKKICAALKPILNEQNIAICGIDVIGNYLTEINVTSPIGFKEVEELYNKPVADEFWAKVELMIAP